MVHYNSNDEMRAISTEDELATKVAELSDHYLQIDLAILETPDNVTGSVLAAFAELAAEIASQTTSHVTVKTEHNRLRVIRPTTQNEREESALSLMASALYYKMQTDEKDERGSKPGA